MLCYHFFWNSHLRPKLSHFCQIQSSYCICRFFSSYIRIFWYIDSWIQTEILRCKYHFIEAADTSWVPMRQVQRCLRSARSTKKWHHPRGIFTLCGQLAFILGGIFHDLDNHRAWTCAIIQALYLHKVMPELVILDLGRISFEEKH